jgi:hypothetical protein
MTRQAAAAVDPVQRNYTVAAANIAQLVHTQAMTMMADFAEQIRESATGAIPLPKEDVKQLLAMTDRLVTLGREIDQCRRRFTVRARR